MATTPLAVRVEETTKAHLEAEAQRAGVSFSDHVRSILERHVAGAGGGSSSGDSISPAEIREGLLELREGGDIDYKGASGNVNFEDNGNVTSGFIIWQSLRDSSNKVVYRTIARFTSEELLEQIR